MKFSIKHFSLLIVQLLILTITSSSFALQVNKGEFGVVTVEPFNPTWLEDFPNVKEHIQTEHLLHVMGKDEDGEGLTWHKEKFVTSGGLDPLYAPNSHLDGAKEGGIQFKLPYFIVPKELMKSVYSEQVSSDARKELEIYDKYGNVLAYRFFVHPEGFNHFKPLLKNTKIYYVSPEESEYMTSATSSYRSLVTRKVEKDSDGNWVGAPDTIPVVVKLGVAGEVLGSDRWLSTNEINRSIRVQRAFDSFEPSVFQGEYMKMYIFPETVGIYLDSEQFEGYPPRRIINTQSGSEEVLAKESGILIREFPKEMLENKIQILSFAAVMSPERVKPENAGLGGHNENYPGFEHLPYIFELVSFARDQNLVANTDDFFRHYLIDGYLDCLDVAFKEGITIEPHSQNFSIVLNREYIPVGFAYRDHGGVTVDMLTRASLGKDIEVFRTGEDNPVKTFKGKMAHTSGYLSMHSWFYRYQVFNKTLNSITKPVLVQGGELQEMMPAPIGAPYQIGFDRPLQERNLYPYIVAHLPSEQKEQIVDDMASFLLAPEQLNDLLSSLDEKYYNKLAEYFDMDKLQLKLVDGMIFSAEGGSGKEHLYEVQHNGFTMSHKDAKNLRIYHMMGFEQMPKDLADNLLDRLITSRTVDSIDDLNIDRVGVSPNGSWFYHHDEPIAFMPYMSMNEKLRFQEMS